MRRMRGRRNCSSTTSVCSGATSRIEILQQDISSYYWSRKIEWKNFRFLDNKNLFAALFLDIVNCNSLNQICGAEVNICKIQMKKITILTSRPAVLMTVSMHLFLGLGWTAPWVHKGLELQAMLASRYWTCFWNPLVLSSLQFWTWPSYFGHVFSQKLLIHLFWGYASRGAVHFDRVHDLIEPIKRSNQPSLNYTDTYSAPLKSVCFW